MAGFHPVQLVTILEEIISLYDILKQDGTLDRLVAAEEAIKTELEGNEKLKDLLTKLEALK